MLPPDTDGEPTVRSDVIERDPLHASPDDGSATVRFDTEANGSQRVFARARPPDGVS